MNNPSYSQQVTLTPADNQRLAKLCGPLDSHLQQIEQHLAVSITNRGHHFTIKGPTQQVQLASKVLDHLYQQTEDDKELPADEVYLTLQQYFQSTKPNPVCAEQNKKIVIHTKMGALTARTEHQNQYLTHIQQHAINFAIGPAGTGKTYLAVACAVEALEKENVSRILLVRPVVEAGERLGFLPGDLAQKIDPYLRPLYDALNEMMGAEKVAKLIERNVIEIAPLAYMRGRTLNDAFIILDEAQNCTKEQMRMFLTRIGFGATAVITGDVTQIDLPRDKMSGLKQAMIVLKEVAGISFNHFDHRDVIRHPLIESIVKAYQHYDQGRKLDDDNH